jgi:hypothetical protein
MSANNNPLNDPGLDTVLRQWSVDTSLPPRFQEQVWQRIEKAEIPQEANLSVLLKRLIEVVVPRPRFAYAYLTVLLVSGVAAGSLAAQLKASRLESELSTRYVQSIDPYRSETQLP